MVVMFDRCLKCIVDCDARQGYRRGHATPHQSSSIYVPWLSDSKGTEVEHISLREKYRRSGIGFLLGFIRNRGEVPRDPSRQRLLECNMVGFRTRTTGFGLHPNKTIPPAGKYDEPAF